MTTDRVDDCDRSSGRHGGLLGPAYELVRNAGERFLTVRPEGLCDSGTLVDGTAGVLAHFRYKYKDKLLRVVGELAHFR